MADLNWENWINRSVKVPADVYETPELLAVCKAMESLKPSELFCLVSGILSGLADRLVGEGHPRYALIFRQSEALADMIGLEFAKNGQ